MATTLFESLQKKLTEPAPAPVAQQDTIANALRAKSGKAGSTSGPAASSIAQDTAMGAATDAQQQQALSGALMATNVQQAADAQAQQTELAKQNLASQRQTALADLTTNAQAQAMQLQGQEELAQNSTAEQERLKTQAVMATSERALRELATERNLSVDNIFREFERSNKELAFRKDAAAIEQAGFALALRDKDYLAELNRIASERDLTDKLNYRDEMTRLVMGDTMERLIDDLDFKKALNADQRTWNEKIAQMDLNMAIQLSQAAIRDEATREMWSAGGNIVKSGIDAYYKHDNKNTNNTNNKPDTGIYDHVDTSGSAQGGMLA